MLAGWPANFECFKTEKNREFIKQDRNQEITLNLLQKRKIFSKKKLSFSQKKTPFDCIHPLGKIIEIAERLGFSKVEKSIFRFKSE